MGRTRKYQTAAEKQAAYRERQEREKRNAEALLLMAESTEQDGAPYRPPRRPPVRYYGGKFRIAPWIIQHFPPHVAYFEPFAGGASVLFRKEPSKYEIINDRNGDVVNFFDVLRADADALIRAIQLTPYSREEHKRAYRREPGLDQLERARRFYVRSRMSFGSGEGQYNTGWRFQVHNKRGTSTVEEWNTVDHLWAAAARLKLVQIENDDAFRAIKRFDGPDTLMYIDPPYPFSTRYDHERAYSHEMSDNDHRALADLLRSVQGMVIISGYMCDLYQELYGDWMCVSKDTKTNGNNPATEYLWISPAAQRVDALAAGD